MKEFEKPRMALLPLAEYKETLERLKRLEALCTRAADALEWCREEHLTQNCGNVDLIDDLRRAAEGN